ncbi:hypothetical protein [Streptomyces sp. DH41]|uniref:hypothetical protein n=1 Tax=Streptomyces sp. DH41 TaxID=3040125 RepID=UPI002441B55E|nr:hypothetical protein [Streptomyces sp. DH41]MDG9726066.1 hypothetical protein [Streptomyces sp. DH41]
MRSELPGPDRSTSHPTDRSADRSTSHPTDQSAARNAARNAVAVSVAALITAAALFGALAPKAAALPLPLPATGIESLVTEGITIEGPLINNLTLR